MSEYLDADKMLENLKYAQKQINAMNYACERYFIAHSQKGNKYNGWNLCKDGVCINYTYQSFYYNTDVIYEEGMGDLIAIIVFSFTSWSLPIGFVLAYLLSSNLFEKPIIKRKK